MNKVILMGRLTREPDVRYSQNSDGSMAVARYTLAVDSRLLILSAVLHLADRVNLLKSIFIREPRLPLPAESRQEAIRIRTDREFTRLMWSLTTRNSQRAKLQQQAAKLRIHHQEVIRQHLQVMAL